MTRAGLARQACVCARALDHTHAPLTSLAPPSLPPAQLGACMEMFIIKTGFYDM